MEIDIYEWRRRFSGVTSLVLGIVMLLLPYVPPAYSSLRYLCAFVFLGDAFVKFFDLGIREYSSAAYSFAMAVALFTFFKPLGQPFSEIAALFFVIDGILKVGHYRDVSVFGVSGFDLFVLRTVVSAILTVVIGLSIAFGVKLGSWLVSVPLGLLLVFDGLIKLEYYRVL